MKYILTIWLFTLACIACAETNTPMSCSPKLTASLMKYQVFRKTVYDNTSSNCIVTNDSFFKVKNLSHAEIQIPGFVTGIDTFLNKKIGSIVKITSHAGGHVTIVKLLRIYKENVEELAIFTSNYGFIVTDNNKLEVFTKNIYQNNHCQWLEGDKFMFIKGKFKKTETVELERKCKKITNIGGNFESYNPSN